MTTRTCVTCIFKSGSQCTRQWGVPPKIDPVTGRKLSGQHFMCVTQRRFEYDSCGQSGKWWKPITQKTVSKYREDVDNGKRENIIVRTLDRLLRIFR